MEPFIQGILTIANLLISLFVLIFAIMFVSHTKSVEGRKPWIFLMVAVCIFFAMQLLNTLVILEGVAVDNYSYIFNSMFVAILLFTFIFQYHLILHSELITIVRKHGKNEKK